MRSSLLFLAPLALVIATGCAAGTDDSSADTSSSDAISRSDYSRSTFLDFEGMGFPDAHEVEYQMGARYSFASLSASLSTTSGRACGYEIESIRAGNYSDIGGRQVFVSDELTKYEGLYQPLHGTASASVLLVRLRIADNNGVSPCTLSVKTNSWTVRGG